MAGRPLQLPDHGYCHGPPTSGVCMPRLAHGSPRPATSPADWLYRQARHSTPAAQARVKALLCACLSVCTLPATAQSQALTQVQTQAERTEMPSPSEWEQQTTGQSTVAGVGAISYTTSYLYAGFNHYEAEIWVHWKSAQGLQQQTLYEGIHDQPPARIWGQGRHLCLAMQFCGQGQERCTSKLTAYRHDLSQAAFVEDPSASQLCRRSRP